MRFKFILLLFFGGIYLSSAQVDNTELLNDLYKKGLSFFNSENPDEKSDKKSLDYFLRICQFKPKTSKEAAIICEAQQKIGILKQSITKYQESKQFYQASLNTINEFKLNDTLKFQPYLLLSGLYYYESVYDSCQLFLNKAEQVFQKYPNLSDSERLFNTKGILLFEAGNWQQSLNYLNKVPKNYYKDDFTFANNKAMVLLNLGKSNEALSALLELHKTYPKEEAILINLASILIDRNLTEKAWKYLQKIKTKNNARNIALGKYFLKTNALEKSKPYFETIINTSKTKSINLAMAHYNLGLIALKSKTPNMALNHFQNALINTQYDFNEKNIFKNPGYNGHEIYSIFLLDILSHKTKSLKLVYEQNHDKKWLNASLETYECIIDLNDKLAKDYNQEASRLELLKRFDLNVKSYISMVWDEYKSTKDDKWAKMAFEISEKSKAVILALGINEQHLKTSTDIPPSLIDQETNLNIALAALNRKLYETDEKSKSIFIEKIADIEIKKEKLNEQLNKYPEYRKGKLNKKDNVHLSFIQRFMDKNESLISVCVLENKTLVFGITYYRFKAIEINDVPTLNSEISLLKYNLSKQIALKSTHFIYNKIIEPFEALMGRNTSLIFVGDGIFNGFPIDMLKDNDGRYLIGKYAIHYMFSAKFLTESRLKNNKYSLSAFAPFTESHTGKDHLPSSKSEIEKIKSRNNFTDKMASKSNFMKNLGYGNLLHLATHAVSDSIEAEKSYIQFSKSQTDNKLYLSELSPGMLGNLDLIFLSACDTYGTKNLPAEGVMGLSRAAYLAGCKGLISSLWKAEDYATHYLSIKFYAHLRADNNIEESLRLAKLDLLNDDSMIQFRDPTYWAHLVYVGDQTDYRPANLNEILLIFVIMGVVFLVLCARLVFERYYLEPKHIPAT